MFRKILGIVPLTNACGIVDVAAVLSSSIPKIDSAGSLNYGAQALLLFGLANDVNALLAK